MSYKNWIIQLVKAVISIGGVLVMSGCVLKLLIPATERAFLPQELLLTKEDLPAEWSVVFGPQKVSNNTKPSNSTEIALIKSTEAEIYHERRWDVMERVYRYNSVEGAKEDYALTTSFPGKTDVDRWRFMSNLADEQKISCYTYVNMEYPVCSWVARYEEYEIEVIAWLDPNRINIEDIQELVIKIDEKVIKSFE
ncbi:MAG: hypothetical protein A2136_03660 [Chloroflexi bacterium RBG_16_54_11]|nr:MAG: hypothetical protein A2136_03660 [Chloroflexi bacterium RBG_16_54_11]